MGNPSNKLRVTRPDLTPFVFHFTSGKDPEANMKSILSQRKLLSTRSYICFTESPLTMLGEQFRYMAQFSNPMYSQYGIGFKRDTLIQNYSCRPVIYGDDNEYNLIDESLRWRYEKLDVSGHDFTWLREWRIKGNEFDFSQLNQDEIIVIAPTDVDLQKIVEKEDFDVEFDYDHSTRQSIPYLVHTIRRKWKGVPLSKAGSFKDDNEMEQSLANQFIGEEIK